MSRDTPTFNLRMPVDLKNAIEKEAGISGRSLNAEILDRLRTSLAPRRGGRGSYVAEPGAPEYAALSDSDRAMLAVFRGLSPEKQLALLSLFK